MSLLDDLLAKPVGPGVAPREDERELTAKIERNGDDLIATLVAEPGSVDDDAARAFIERKGLNPDEWEATGFRASEWGDGLESRRFTFKRVAKSLDIPIDDLIERVLSTPRTPPTDFGPDGAGFVVGIGDMQFGKIDGDGAEGALKRTVECIDKAVEECLTTLGDRNISHVHVAWLGDHVEGFVSQGGANVWRTNLTMSEQIRLTRRVMLYAMEQFAPYVRRLTMAAVPGNHGEPQRFNGKGVTRYDDSHDTESLIAVSDAAQLNKEAFGHVEFYVPQTDEMTVVLDVAGTRVGHAHGHQWRPTKHFDWWEGQAFGKSPLRDADILLAGHLHHLHVEENGGRTYVGVPALEDESTWWRHSTGIGGNPGIFTMLTQAGRVLEMKVVR